MNTVKKVWARACVIAVTGVLVLVAVGIMAWNAGFYLGLAFFVGAFFWAVMALGMAEAEVNELRR